MSCRALRTAERRSDGEAEGGMDSWNEGEEVSCSTSVCTDQEREESVVVNAKKFL